MYINDIFKLHHNVKVKTYDEYGVIHYEIQSHNIVINTGRTFLRDIVAAKSYTISSSDPPPATPTYSDIVPWTAHKIRYIAVGTGGALQSYGYPGSGSYTEIVTTKGLERPIPVIYRPEGLPNHPECQWQWMKQVEPQIDSNTLPDEFSVIFKAIFYPHEISFPEQIGSYGTVVPVSEFLLLTSAAEVYTIAPTDKDRYYVYNDDNSLYVWPNGSEYFPGYNGDIPAAVAYNISLPVPKTPNLYMEVLWELRS